MPKIVLDVPEVHLQSIMTVLKSLKSELISNIEVDTQSTPQTAQPISSSLNKKHQPYQRKQQEEPRPVKRASKYLSPNEFKQKLTRKQ